MNKIKFFILSICFGITIAFPLLYIYEPSFVKCKKEFNQDLLIGIYTFIFSLIFTIVCMSLITSIQLKCLK